MTDMLTSLIESGQVIKAHRINRGWLEIDNLRDLEVAETNLTINNTGSIEVIFSILSPKKDTLQEQLS